LKVNPNVANLRRGKKTRQSASDVAEHSPAAAGSQHT